jgi:2,4-dienoyl-CoA reductase-like NADH-dependent reductase (Old Yellow Enzyme family)
MMSRLFSPFRVREIECRNRIFMSPMCQYSAENGFANHWHLIHYGNRAIGGTGLIIMEATAVSPEGRISPADLGLWDDQHVDALKPITDFIKSQGAVPAIQLAHAGRKACTDRPWLGGKPISIDAGGWQPLAPSAVPFTAAHNEPRSMTVQDIDNTVAAFSAAAQRAQRAGFDVVEIHMAHGYLLHEFLSPLSNQRQDEYGGSFDNRTRLPLRVVRAVREVWPDLLPLFVRISATDWVEGGWDLEQSVDLARMLKDNGVDLIDCSSGGTTVDAPIPAGPGFQTPFATTIRHEVDIATGAVGIITEAVQAEHIIATGLADVVIIGREFLRDPHWPLHAAKKLNVDIPWPNQYRLAKR